MLIPIRIVEHCAKMAVENPDFWKLSRQYIKERWVWACTRQVDSLWRNEEERLLMEVRELCR